MATWLSWERQSQGGPILCCFMHQEQVPLTNWHIYGFQRTLTLTKKTHTTGHQHCFAIIFTLFLESLFIYLNIMFEIFLLFFQKNLSGVSNFLENSGKYKMHKTFTLNIHIIYFFAKSSLLTYRFAISAVASGGDFPIVAAIFLGSLSFRSIFLLNSPYSEIRFLRILAIIIGT